MNLGTLMRSVRRLRSRCSRRCASPLGAQRADSTRARRGCAAARRRPAVAAAADLAAARVPLFVPRSRIGAGRARPNKAAAVFMLVEAISLAMIRESGGRRARSAAHRERHASSCQYVDSDGTSQRHAGTCAAALQRRVRPHAIGARRGLGRAPRREPSLRRRRRVRRRAPVGRAGAHSDFVCYRDRAGRPSVTRRSSGDDERPRRSASSTRASAG